MDPRIELLDDRQDTQDEVLDRHNQRAMVLSPSNRNSHRNILAHAEQKLLALFGVFQLLSS